MKVKISFEIDYNNPSDRSSYDMLIKKIKHYLNYSITADYIPEMHDILFKELSPINITDDYELL